MPPNRRGRQWLTVVAGQQDRCLILPYTATYVREGVEPGGAQRLAIPKSVVYIVGHIVSLRLALRAPVLFRGAVPVGMVFRVYRSSANCTSLACPAPLCVLDSWVIVCSRDGEDRQRIAQALLRLGNGPSSRKRPRAWGCVNHQPRVAASCSPIARMPFCPRLAVVDLRLLGLRWDGGMVGAHPAGRSRILSLGGPLP
jgi:hypothetical protein